MIKKLLFAAIVFTTFAGFAQPDKFKEIGMLTFETEPAFLKQATPTTSIWQIGEPEKNLFKEAYSGKRAIITDSTSPYPPNNHSWFDLVLPLNEFVSYYQSVFISFYHKINTDTLGDGGYITVSYDMGKSWQNIIEDTMDWFELTPKYSYMYEQKLYSAKNILYNGEYGFSGIIKDWQLVKFEWLTMACKTRNAFFEDTMLVRFNFISDATESARDGWMIDDIRLLSNDYGGNVHEIALQSAIDVYPNPAQDVVSIQTKNAALLTRLEVFNVNGRKVSEFTPNTQNFTLYKNELQSGVYLLRCTFSNGGTETIKLTWQ